LAMLSLLVLDLIQKYTEGGGQWTSRDTRAVALFVFFMLAVVGGVAGILWFLGR